MSATRRQRNDMSKSVALDKFQSFSTIDNTDFNSLRKPRPARNNLTINMNSNVLNSKIFMKSIDDMNLDMVDTSMERSHESSHKNLIE